MNDELDRYRAAPDDPDAVSGVRVLFNDGTARFYHPYSGGGGHPTVPFTVEFRTGYGDDLRTISIPLFAIKEIEFDCRLKAEHL